MDSLFISRQFGRMPVMEGSMLPGAVLGVSRNHYMGLLLFQNRNLWRE